MSGFVFVARFPGRCGACDEAIHPGQPVTYEDDTLIHVDCEACAPVERPVTICTTCHLTTPCDCEATS